MATHEGKDSGAPDSDHYDEEDSPSSRLGGDIATDESDEAETSKEVRKAAIGEREPLT
ncbi:MAG: hypothetical protein ACJ735_17700 [Actinomycetes bacterium]